MPTSVGREASHRPAETKSTKSTSASSGCTSGTESIESFQAKLEELEQEPQQPGSGQPPNDATTTLLLLQRIAANGGLPAGSTVTSGFQGA